MRQIAFARFLKPVLGLLLLAGLCWQMDSTKLLTLTKHADPGWLFFGLFVYILSNVMSAWRWQRIATYLGYVCPLPAILWLYAQGLALNALLPGGIVGGDLWRSMQLAERAKKDACTFGLQQAALSVFLDRVGGLWGLSIWSVLTWGLAAYFLVLPAFQAWPSLSFFETYLGFLLIAALLPAIAFCLMRFIENPFAKSNRAPQIAGILQKLFGKVTVKIGQNAECADTLSRLDSLWLTLPHSIAVQMLATLALWACLQSLGQPLHYLCVAGLSFAIFLSAVVPASFGGFGARELACVVILGWAGVAEEVAFSASVLFGLLGFLQGALGAMGWFRKNT